MRKTVIAALLLMPALAFATDEPSWITDKRGCKIANPAPKSGETVEWSGSCPQGMAHGTGVLQFYNAGKPGARYEGELSKGVLSGKGVLRSADGSVYDGDWVDGKPEGYGKFTDKDGNTYVGGWTAGAQDGPGTLTSKDGQRITGTWRGGKYVDKK